MDLLLHLLSAVGYIIWAWMDLVGTKWAWWAWSGRDHSYLTEFNDILHGSALTPSECRGLHYLGVCGRGRREMGVDGRNGREMGVATPIESISMKFCMDLLLHPLSVVGYIN